MATAKPHYGVTRHNMATNRQEMFNGTAWVTMGELESRDTKRGRSEAVSIVADMLRVLKSNPAKVLDEDNYRDLHNMCTGYSLHCYIRDYGREADESKD